MGTPIHWRAEVTQVVWVQQALTQVAFLSLLVLLSHSIAPQKTKNVPKRTNHTPDHRTNDMLLTSNTDFPSSVLSPGYNSLTEQAPHLLMLISRPQCLGKHMVSQSENQRQHSVAKSRSHSSLGTPEPLCPMMDIWGTSMENSLGFYYSRKAI